MSNGFGYYVELKIDRLDHKFIIPHFHLFLLVLSVSPRNSVIHLAKLQSSEITVPLMFESKSGENLINSCLLLTVDSAT